MNSLNNGNKQFATTIVPRYLEKDGKTAFFFADEKPEGDTMLAYVEGEGVKEVPKEVYKGGKRLHPDDVAVALEIYKRESGVAMPVARERMFYKKAAATELPRRLVNVNTTTGDVVIDQEMIDAEKDKEKKAVMEYINKTNVEQKPKRKYSKKADYWKNPTKKRRAKPVEEQAPVVQPDVSFRQAEAAANKAVKSKSGGTSVDSKVISRIVAEVLTQMQKAH